MPYLIISPLLLPWLEVKCLPVSNAIYGVDQAIFTVGALPVSPVIY
jgi:hypothetical protein